MQRRELLKTGGTAGILAAAQFPLITGAIAQDKYAKYRGQTVVINFPAHPHYDQAEKLFAEFTKETGIKVERDKMQYLRMKDKQVLEMGKPQGDYDIITYNGTGGGVYGSALRLHGTIPNQSGGAGAVCPGGVWPFMQAPLRAPARRRAAVPGHRCSPK